jgi:hypothetical protein
MNNGYLKARNNGRVKFYLMWANHDVTHLWDIRIAHIDNNVIWRASVDRREFETIARRLIDPDDLYGYGYLEAVKQVFGQKGTHELASQMDEAEHLAGRDRFGD